eukprot:TRINITY_DN7285_c1_g2_i1.p1 TRINITY_DN7285_c1_g2~~TRINITY_DN7285_c1_g2_i1.p1  ORF type:complete len:646 (-),score=159.50 TRINITY_DN7285_c1_g2_i1:329-2179(-)
MDDFTKCELLGTGSFCDVFKCTDSVTGQQYAMKIVPKRRSEIDQACIMEAHCLRRLERSPDIVNMIWDIDTPLQWISILELCEGGEMWSQVRQCGCVAEGEPIWYAGQMVEALCIVHAAGIVHRDLKCENFMIAANRKLKLIDFGTARDTEHPEVAPMLLGPQYEHHVGTPNFMSPEAVNGKANDRKSDLWSLGCCVYQLITGAPPFNAPAPCLVLAKAQEGKIWMPSKGLTPHERDFIAQLTQVVPERRYGAVGGQTRRVLRHPFLRVPPTRPPADDTLLADTLRRIGRAAADEAVAASAAEAAAAAGEEGLEFEAAEGPLQTLGGLVPPVPKIGAGVARLLDALPALQVAASAAAGLTVSEPVAFAVAGAKAAAVAASAAAVEAAEAVEVAASVAEEAEQISNVSESSTHATVKVGRGVARFGGVAKPLTKGDDHSDDAVAEAKVVVELLRRVHAALAKALSPQDFIRHLAESWEDSCPEEEPSLPPFVRSVIERFAEMAEQHCLEAREQVAFNNCDSDSESMSESAEDEQNRDDGLDEDVGVGQLDIAHESERFGEATTTEKKTGGEGTPSTAELSSMDENSTGDRADVPNGADTSAARGHSKDSETRWQRSI